MAAETAPATAHINPYYAGVTMGRANRVAALAIIGACVVGLADSPAVAQSEKDSATPAFSDPARKKDAGKKVDSATRADATLRGDAASVSSDPQVTTASFGDWVERCQRVASGDETVKLCEIAQTFQIEGQSAPIAQLAVGRLKKTDPLRLTLVLPVNAAFPSAPKISVEGKGSESIELSWRRCVPSGCIADAVVSDELIAALRNEKNSGHIESKNGAGQTFSFALSFRGLGPAFDALMKETSGS